MADWAAIERELNAWHAAGQIATFWWRDDDAICLTPPLSRLLAINEENQIPLFLAVIPTRLQLDLVEAVHHRPRIAILQHGYAHTNHAPPDRKKSEFPPNRPMDLMLNELEYGQQRLLELLPNSALPVLVPPWNRIAPQLIAGLPALGFAGLSTCAPRDVREPVPGLLQVNTHIDIIDWRHGRGFVGTEDALDQILVHLIARRMGQADRDEATGLLTHHLVHTEQCWDFVLEFFTRSAAHSAVRWLGQEVFSG